jgi:hypothetical protein
MTLDPSIEHIIPLSLGGHDDFAINVDRRCNSDIGSRIDGRMANDFLMLFDRDEAFALGHSKKHPHPIVKSATLCDGTPAQVTFGGKTGLEVFNLKEKRILDRSDSLGGTINLNNIKIDIDIDIMFVAKVALAAGYFSYHDHFRNHVDHSEFREIMNLNKRDLPSNSKALGYNRFCQPDDKDIFHHTVKIITEMHNCSTVIMFPSQERFRVAVALLGRFLGFISAPSESKSLPNDNEYRHGHCIYLLDGEVKQCSFEHILKKTAEVIEEYKNYHKTL